MKKLFLTSLVVLGIAASALATDISTNAVVTPKTLFRFNELSLKVDTSYQVNGGKSQGFNDDINVGIQYFPSKYFGIEVNAPIYTDAGFDVKDVSADILVRYPIEFKSWAISPYLGVGADYNWGGTQNSVTSYITTTPSAPPCCDVGDPVTKKIVTVTYNHWTYFAKVGLEERFAAIKHLSIFEEYQYSISDFGQLGDGIGQIVAGVKFTF